MFTYHIPNVDTFRHLVYKLSKLINSAIDLWHNLNQTKMRKLFSTDYVVYDKANDHPLQWEINGDIIIFGTKQEALNDCRGNESVIPCTDLPIHWQEQLLKQINKKELFHIDGYRIWDYSYKDAFESYKRILTF